MYFSVTPQTSAIHTVGGWYVGYTFVVETGSVRQAHTNFCSAKSLICENAPASPDWPARHHPNAPNHDDGPQTLHTGAGSGTTRR